MLGLRVRCGLLLGGAQVGLKARTAHACSSGSLSPAHTLWGYCPARCTSGLARLRLLCRTCSLRRMVWRRNLPVYIYIYIRVIYVYTYSIHIRTYSICTYLDLRPIISNIICTHVICGAFALQLQVVARLAMCYWHRNYIYIYIRIHSPGNQHQGDLFGPPLVPAAPGGDDGSRHQLAIEANIRLIMI